MSFESTLSRVLANENLTIVYSHKAKTASFDEKTRTLCFPVFAPTTPDVVREAFSVHEIGHAKHTPKTLRHDKYKDGKTIPFSVLNVLEDIRIENLLKEEYPGASRTFAKAYAIHFENGFFGAPSQLIADQAKLHRLSRLNVIAKVGKLSGIHAKDLEERAIFDQALAIKTIDELLAVAELLYQLDKKPKPAPKKPEPKPEVKSKPEPLVQPKTEEDQKTTPEAKPEAAEKEEAEKSEEEGESSPAMDGDDLDEADSCAAPSDEEDDGEDAKSDKADDEAEEGEESEEEANSGSAGDGASADSGPTLADHEQEETQDEFDDKISSIFADNVDCDDKFYFLNASLYEQLWFNGILKPWSMVADRSVSHVAAYDAQKRQAAGKRWRLNGMKAQALAAAFEQMVSGINLANSTDMETGELDDNLLWAHKLTEHLFQEERMTVDQKNHGIVMMCDFSGSMAGDKLKEVINRMMIMTQFARLASIPFRVIAFGLRADIYNNPELDQMRRYNANFDGAITASGANFCLVPKNIGTVVEIASNEMTESQLYSIFSALYMDLCSKSRFDSPIFHMAGTPMMAALLAMPSYIENMKSQEHIQKVCMMLLTDGAPDSDVDVAYRNEHGIGRQIVGVREENEYPGGRAVKTFFTHQTNNQLYQLTVQDTLRMIGEITGAYTVYYKIIDHYYSLPNTSLFDPKVVEATASAQLAASNCAFIRNQGGIDLQCLIYQKEVTDSARRVLERKAGDEIEESVLDPKSEAVKKFMKAMKAEKKEAMFAEVFVGLFA